MNKTNLAVLLVSVFASGLWSGKLQPNPAYAQAGSTETTQVIEFSDHQVKAIVAALMATSPRPEKSYDQFLWLLARIGRVEGAYCKDDLIRKLIVDRVQNEVMIRVKPEIMERALKSTRDSLGLKEGEEF